MDGKMIPHGFELCLVDPHTGVERVHHLNLWSLCSHISVLTAHVEVSSPSHVLRRWEVPEEIRATLRRQYRIEHVTLQPECWPGCTPSTIRA